MLLKYFNIQKFQSKYIQTTFFNTFSNLAVFFLVELDLIENTTWKFLVKVEEKIYFRSVPCFIQGIDL